MITWTWMAGEACWSREIDIGLALDRIRGSMDGVVLIAPGGLRGKRFAVDVERNS